MLDERPETTGTAFWIGPCIAITAVHVIDELIFRLIPNSTPISRGYSGLLDLRNITLGIRRYFSPIDFIGFKVTHAFRSAFCEDAAILFLSPTGEPTKLWDMPFKHLGLILPPPERNNHVWAFGMAGGQVTDPTSISSYAVQADGEVTDVYDEPISPKNPFPGFAVRTDWPGGMSGGPVFPLPGNNGVIGFVTAGIGGIDDETPVPNRRVGSEPPVGIAACLWPLLGDVFQAPDVNEGLPFTLRNLAEKEELSSYRINIEEDVKVEILPPDGEIEEVRLIQDGVPREAWPVARRTRVRKSPLDDLTGR